MSTTAAKSKSSRTNRKGTGKSAKSIGSKAKSASANSKVASAKTANKDGGKRLNPGGLNDLVLGYMKKNRGKLPITAGTVGRGIKRSSGAVANCLRRLEREGKVKLTNKKPREYDLTAAKYALTQQAAPVAARTPTDGPTTRRRTLRGKAPGSA